MLANLFKIGGWRKAPLPDLAAHNENVPGVVATCPDAPQGHQPDQVDPEKVRALRTGAAIAVSLDGSPAVLVNIYDYAHRVRGQRRR